VLQGVVFHDCGANDNGQTKSPNAPVSMASGVTKGEARGAVVPGAADEWAQNSLTKIF